MKIAVLGLVPLFAATAGFSADLEVLPPTSVLSSPESRQRLIVQATVDGFNEDWSQRARWESSNPDVARVDEAGIVTPVGDGEAIISATVEGRKASAKVVVKDARARFQWSSPRLVAIKVRVTERLRGRMVSNLRFAATTHSWTTTR